MLSELRDRLGSMPQSEAMRRAVRVARLARRTARAGGSGGPDGGDGGGGVELPALASLGAQLLARPEAQRQIADLSVRLAERAVVGSLRVAFDPPPQEEAEAEDDGAEAAEAAPEPPEPPAPAPDVTAVAAPPEAGHAAAPHADPTPTPTRSKKPPVRPGWTRI